jgi:hypothetical protein
VSESDRRLSPLFIDPNDKGVFIYADNISQIFIYRMVPQAGRGPRRAKIPRLEYRREDGTEFVFDPFLTTEDDIIEHFGGGEYFIEALGHDGKKLSCGHSLYLDAPQKRRRWTVPGAAAAPAWMQRQHPKTFGYDPFAQPNGDEDDEDDDEDEDMSGFAQQMLKAQQKQAADMQRQADERAREARLEAREQASANTNIVGKVLESAMGTRGQDSSAIDTIREQLREQSDRHREELRRRDDAAEARCKDLRDEVKKREDRIDDLRREHNSEIDGMRRDHRTEIDKIRLKHDAEIGEFRSEIKESKHDHMVKMEETRRHALSVADLDVERLKKRLSDAENDLARVKRELEKENHELKNEIYELQRDLADAPQEGATPKLPAGTPWWGAVGAEAAKWWSQKQAEAARTNALQQQQQQRQGSVPVQVQQSQPVPQAAPQQAPQPTPQPVPQPHVAPPPVNLRETPAPPPDPTGPPPSPTTERAMPSNGRSAHAFSFDDVEPFVDDGYEEDEGDEEDESDEADEAGESQEA